MNTRFVSLTLFLACLLSIKALWLSSSPVPEFQLLSAVTSMQNGESQIAVTGKVRLATAELYDLELIKGISDRLGSEILSNRAVILERARRYLPGYEYMALELVHGIGPKTAEQLGKSISFD